MWYGTINAVVSMIQLKEACPFDITFYVKM